MFQIGFFLNIGDAMQVLHVFVFFYLRIKSWKPECVLSFNMGWRIKFTNIRLPILNLKTHSGFHELFRF
jgi:hypothetical protein